MLRDLSAQLHEEDWQHVYQAGSHARAAGCRCLCAQMKQAVALRRRQRWYWAKQTW